MIIKWGGLGDHNPSSLRDCVTMGKLVMAVILSEAKNLIISKESITEILPCLPAGGGYRLRMTLRHSRLARGRKGRVAVIEIL